MSATVTIRLRRGRNAPDKEGEKYQRTRKGLYDKWDRDFNAKSALEYASIEARGRVQRAINDARTYDRWGKKKEAAEARKRVGEEYKVYRKTWTAALKARARFDKTARLGRDFDEKIGLFGIRVTRPHVTTHEVKKTGGRAPRPASEPATVQPRSVPTSSPRNSGGFLRSIANGIKQGVAGVTSSLRGR